MDGDNLFSVLARRGYVIEFASGAVHAIVNKQNHRLENPTLKELGQLASGVSIDSLKRARG